MEAILDECHGLPVAVFAPRDRLVLEGAPAEAMFVLIEGRAEVVRGGMTLTSIGAPGALVGEMSALLGHPCSATVRAVTEIRAYRIENAGHFLAERPVLLLRTAQLLAQRLDHATALLSEIRAEQSGRGVETFGVIDDVLGTLMSEADRKFARQPP